MSAIVKADIPTQRPSCWRTRLHCRRTPFLKSDAEKAGPPPRPVASRPFDKAPRKPGGRNAGQYHAESNEVDQRRGCRNDEEDFLAGEKVTHPNRASKWAK